MARDYEGWRGNDETDESRYRDRGYGGGWRGSRSNADFYGGDAWRGAGGYGGENRRFGSQRDYEGRGERYAGYDRPYGYPGYGYAGSGRDYEESGAYGERNRRGFWDRAGDEVSSWFGDEDAERRRQMDKYRGRGPKGYTRSDERIEEDINDRLTDDWSLDASDIEVSVEAGEVTLSGEVASRADKRRAEDIAEDVSGVKNVQNNLRVRAADAEARTATM